VPRLPRDLTTLVFPPPPDFPPRTKASPRRIGTPLRFPYRHANTSVKYAGNHQEAFSVFLKVISPRKTVFSHPTFFGDRYRRPVLDSPSFMEWIFAPLPDTVPPKGSPFVEILEGFSSQLPHTEIFLPPPWRPPLG